MFSFVVVVVIACACACVRKRSLFLGGGAVGVLRQGLGWPDWDSAFILRW